MAKQADYPAQNRKENKKVQFIVSREFAGSQTMREARPCGKPLSSLLNGRPVNGLRNGKNGKPAKGRNRRKNGNPA